MIRLILSSMSYFLNSLIDSLISRYIIYTKILQWINFDFMTFLGDDFNLYLKRFTDNAPYIKSDIDFISLNKLKEIGKKYNIEIDDTPINSGTISLVFVGKIKNYRGNIDNQENKEIKIAIKLLRNGIEKKINSAIYTLKFIVRILNYIPTVRKLYIDKLIDDIEESLLDQINFKKESESIKNFDRKLKKNKNIKTVKLIDELTFDNIITMEFINGRSVFKLNEDEKKHFCKLLISTVYYIQLKKMVYHMDLHPGNIMYTDDGKITYLDLGMIENLSPQESNFMLDYMTVIVSNDDISDSLKNLIKNYRDILFDEGNIDCNFTDLILQKNPNMYKNKNAFDQTNDTKFFISNLYLSGCKISKRLNKVLFGFVSFLNFFTLFDREIQVLITELIQKYECQF